ncbi:MAG TPA: DUF4855 domain-containing protein [Armatimonadota bacterium]|jgi:hypothetical protein
MRWIPLIAALAAAIAPARAEYPTPQVAGFHHCALIYDTDPRGPAEFAPYVAYDKQPAWLFDAFLFLIQSSGRGRGTEYGETQKPDWDYQLDRWFAPDRDLSALDAAIEAASKRLGPPPAKRRVMLAIPYVNRGVRDFGVVNGAAVDLSTPEGRDAAVRWYVEAAMARFQAAGYRHLELWGFYWMREDIGEDDIPIVKAASAIVHSTGHRLLWIPCNGDTGFGNWKRAGVDVAIYQPNYAFGTWQHGGRIGRNRIAVTAEAARKAGLGVEMECFDIASSAADRRVFAQYLADGAPGRFGYQAGATAYYTAEDMVEQTARSKDSDVRSAYDNLARYVLNKPVPNPDAHIRWRWRTQGSARLAEARFAAPRSIAALEAFLNESASRGWRGTLEVTVLRPRAKRWTPGGWTIRGGGTANDGRHQGTMAPVGGRAIGVRVAFRPMSGSGPLNVSSLAADPNDVPGTHSHAALGAAYALEPSPPAKYADKGHMLTDGVTAGGYISGHAVGWMAAGKDVAVSFDLGKPMPISQVIAFTQGGGFGAVYWPDRSAAMFSTAAAPPAAAEGRGVLPGGFTCVPGGPVVVDGRRSATDIDGHIPFRPAKPAMARYVTLLFHSASWVMLSEVRIMVNGRNVAPGAVYTLRPQPGARDEASGGYPDDGVRLTDGVVATNFEAGQLAGWQDAAPRTVTVDLGAALPIREVTAWSLGGGRHAIFAPRSATVSVSTDGRAWRPLGEAHLTDPRDGGCRPIACRVRASAPTRARYVKVRVERLQDWAMLSEIEVH